MFGKSCIGQGILYKRNVPVTYLDISLCTKFQKNEKAAFIYYAQTDFGSGTLYRTSATAYVWLEQQTINYNSYNFLIVSKHLNYPLKRSLTRFDISTVPSTCNVVFARMYLHFWYTH